MRIISKVRDYYDIGQGLGQDQSIIYVRDEKVIETPGLRVYPQCFTPYTIGFCGNLYSVLRAWWQRIKGDLHAWCYSVEDCDRFVAQLDEEDQDKYFGRGKRRRYLSSVYYSSYTTHPNVKSFFEKERRNTSRMTEVFHKHNTPVVVWQPDKTVVNPLLRPYEFYRIKEPYTAFQEIQQYVGGVLLAKVNPVPEISDEIKVELAGFDKVTSFRKSKEKK